MKENKRYILLILIIIFIIVIIFGINKLKANKNNLQESENTTKINVVQNELSGEYELYNETGDLIKTAPDNSMLEIYKTDPTYNPNPNF